MTTTGETRSGSGSVGETDRWATLARFAEGLFAASTVEERVALIAGQARELSQATQVRVEVAREGKPKVLADSGDPTPAPEVVQEVSLVGRDAVPLGCMTLSGSVFARGDAVVMHYLQIAAYAVDNARLFEQCQDALHARDEILAVVSHDLRTPLNAIALGAHVLTRVSLDEPQRAVKLAQMLEAVRHAARLIDDLLEVAQQDAGQLALECRECHAPTVVGEAVDMLRPALEAKGVSLQVSVLDNVPRLRADPMRVTQVIHNVLDNALRVSDDNVSLIVERVGDEARVAVSDSGPGIAPDELPRLFDRYWQGHKKVRGRVGLGLSIARGIVEAHGGRIWAENRPGRGATIYFTLPLASAPA